MSAVGSSAESEYKKAGPVRDLTRLAARSTCAFVNADLPEVFALSVPLVYRIEYAVVWKPDEIIQVGTRDQCGKTLRVEVAGLKDLLLLVRCLEGVKNSVSEAFAVGGPLDAVKSGACVRCR